MPGEPIYRGWDVAGRIGRHLKRSLSNIGKADEARATDALADGAHLRRTKIVNEDPNAFHLATTRVRQEGNSGFHSKSFALDGQIVRNHIDATLDG